MNHLYSFIHFLLFPALSTFWSQAPERLGKHSGKRQRQACLLSKVMKLDRKLSETSDWAENSCSNMTKNLNTAQHKIVQQWIRDIFVKDVLGRP